MDMVHDHPIGDAVLGFLFEVDKNKGVVVDIIWCSRRWRTCWMAARTGTGLLVLAMGESDGFIVDPILLLHEMHACGCYVRH
jgi:hypothetical protein